MSPAAKDARGRCGRKADRPCAGDIDRRSGADLGGDGSIESGRQNIGEVRPRIFSGPRERLRTANEMPAIARRRLQITPSPYHNDTLMDALGPRMCGQASGLRDALGSGS
jgi:hypothetical protein